MRLIDADALKSVEKEVVCGKVRTPYAKDKTAVLRVFEVDEIRNAPTIDAEPVRHGHWERIEYVSGDWMRCSACGDNIWTAGEFAELGYLKSFCPKCGAKMDEVSTND